MSPFLGQLTDKTLLGRTWPHGVPDVKNNRGRQIKLKSRRGRRRKLEALRPAAGGVVGVTNIRGWTRVGRPCLRVYAAQLDD